MNIVLDRLEAMLPTQSAPEPGSPFADPHALRSWLDGLRLADRHFARMRLRDALREFNTLLMAPRQRLAMLETFELTAAALVDDVKNEVREFFPMSTQRVDEIRLADEIECELALGYGGVACALAERSGAVPFLQRGCVAKALVRASACQKARLWLACRRLAAPPAGVWQGLHDLFGFSIACGCADRESILVQGGMRSSTRSIYIQALLLAFAKPNQFTQARNRQLHTGLPVLASWCEVRRGRAANGAIAVCSTSDMSPPAMPAEVWVDTGAEWTLDPRSLLAQLDTLVAGSHGQGEITLRALYGDGAATLAVDLVDALRRVWSGYTEREAPRSVGQAWLETEVGLSRVHSHLTGCQDLESASPLAGETSLPVAGWALHVPDRSEAKHACAEVMDCSRHGYRLRWKAGEDARARVGELIALAPMTRGERKWRYGALRWLRTQGDAAVEAGVELLSSPIPVAVYALDANGVSLAPVRGILVGASSDGKHANTQGILVPRPFARDVAGVEVLRIDETNVDTMPRAVRVTQFSAEDAGLYQKIVLPGEAIDRIVDREAGESGART